MIPKWRTALLVAVGLVVLAIMGPRHWGRAGEAKLLARPEAFTTLVNPDCSHCVDEAKRRAGELRDDERVLAWTRGNYEGGGIPYRFFLVPYRVISDTYGVFVYDPDAGFARGYEPSLDFRFHGWRNGIMVIAHKDGTLFSALSGRAFAGPRAGDELKPIATITTNWGSWRRGYPGSVAYRMFEKYQPTEVPGEASRDSLSTRGPVDPRLSPETEVLGVSLNGRARAYTVAALRDAAGVLADELAGERLVVLWNEATGTAAAYSPEVDGTDPPQSVILRRDAAGEQAPFVDDETRSRWGVEGRAVEGPLKGKTLRWLPAVQCRWFAWAAEYPQTELVASSEETRAADAPKQSDAAKQHTTEAVLVEPADVNPQALDRWKNEGYTAVAIVLDERFPPDAYQAAAESTRSATLDLFYWIEVARNSAMANAHPRWMAALGMHDDWRARFPDTPPTSSDKVAKAYPWVPIGYREAFDAHLERVEGLLSLASRDYRGLLLNDLQGGPSACGCGNLQCRWAIDYRVPSTAEVLTGDDVAARFMERVRALVPTTSQLIPVWTSECEAIDLPERRAGAESGTGLCGSVRCAATTCPQAFARQWRALLAAHSGDVALLATHKELGRSGGVYRGAGWLGDAVNYVRSKVEPGLGASLTHERLWIVVQGYDVSDAELADTRQEAISLEPHGIIVSKTRIDQSYTPRIIDVSE